MWQKYITYQDSNTEKAITFDPDIQHSDAAKLYNIPTKSILGAGIVIDNRLCMGESTTLEIKSRGEIDLNLITKV